MRRDPSGILEIGLWTDLTAPPRPVGRLAWAQGRSHLEWAPEALSAGLLISPVHYPLERGLFAARTFEFDGLHGFLADSLPDAWGTLLLRKQLRRLGRDLDALNPIERLALIGQRGRGALVYRPESLDGAVEWSGSLDLDALASEAYHILQGEKGEVEDLLARLGGGSGGARPKLHVMIAGERAFAGREVGEEGVGSHWIVKFAGPHDPPDIGPIEAAYANMARAAGLVIADTKLLPSNGVGGYFATQRFDRPTVQSRRHMVSLAGAIEASPHMPSLDYDGFLKATLAITRDMRDVSQAFRRMLFNILAHNRDDHARQHAYLMDDKGQWRLAPAFDLTFSNGPGGEHYMSVMGEGRDIERAHVEALAKRHGIRPKEFETIIDEVRSAIADWRLHAASANATISRDEISARLSTLDRRFMSK